MNKVVIKLSQGSVVT